MIQLEHIKIVQLNDDTWLATACFTQIINTQQSIHLAQKQAVRQLLKELVSSLNGLDCLDESVFPYRLTDTGQYVSFSHSQNWVAVAISNKNVAIDIEKNSVSDMVANRHFTDKEKQYLKKLPRAQRQFINKLLWQLKECIIKLQQKNLFTGLKNEVLDLIPEDVIHATSQCIEKEKHHAYQQKNDLKVYVEEETEVVVIVSR